MNTIERRVVLGQGSDPITERLVAESRLENPILGKAVVGVWTDGKQRFYSVGRLGEEEGVEIDEHSVFDIASLVKVFVTMLCHILIERCGNFGYDSRVAGDLGLKGNHVEFLTVAHLLQFHAEFLGGHPTKDRLLANDGDFDLLIDEIRRGGLASVPGKDVWKYSNVHSILLGMYLEKKMEKSLEHLMSEWITLPLSMHSTSAHPQYMLRRTVVSEQGLEAGTINDPTARAALKTRGLIGAAGLFSTASDLIRFASLIMRKGISPDGKKLLSKRCIESLHKGLGKRFGNGFGLWNVFKENLVDRPVDPHGLHKLGHTGTFMAMLPSDNTAVVVLTDFLAISRSEEVHVSRRRLNQFCADVTALAVERRFVTEG